MYFNNSFSCNNSTFNSEDWFKRANNRKLLMIDFIRNEKKSTFYDYNFVKKEQQHIYLEQIY